MPTACLTASLTVIEPSRLVEKEVLAGLYATGGGAPVYVAGVDEVGRGALAGPASVGIALVGVDTSDEFPAGLRDSKLLSAKAREAFVQPVRSWVAASAVGHSTIEEINSWGIMAGLRAAAARALGALEGFPIGAVLLDGSHNWWTTPDALFPIGPQLPDIPVRMEVKGDAHCAVIAAASVLAKVERDALMVQAAQRYPGYDWELNKGYASASHIDSLATRGATDFHRTSWNLPGMTRG